MADALDFWLSSDRRRRLADSMAALGLPLNQPADLLALDAETLRRAHRARCRQTHPDNPGATERAGAAEFTRVQRAYETLREFLADRERGAAVRPARVIAVGGAKGGVGKSFLASSLAIALAAGGARVLAADLDFGAANLHLLFGVRRPARTLGEWFADSGTALSDLTAPTAFPRLELLAGEGAHLGAANHAYQQKLKLIRQLRAAPYDVVLCDLGAGASYNTLDYFLAADERLVVTTAEPTSVLDAYATIKTALYRQIAARLKPLAAKSPAARRAAEFFTPTARDLPSLHALTRALEGEDPAIAGQVRQWAAAFRLRLVINRSRGEQDYALLGRLLDLARQNLGVQDVALGRVPDDPAVPAAIASLTPFMGAHAGRPAAQAIVELAATFMEGDRALAMDRIAAALHAA